MTNPGARFYRSNQPWDKGGPSRIPITSHIDHQTSNSLFVPSPFLTYLKPFVIAFFFLFGDTWKQIFSTHCFTMACGLCILLLFVFVFCSALQTCVCSKDYGWEVISTVANARYHYVSYQSQNFVKLSRVGV